MLYSLSYFDYSVIDIRQICSQQFKGRVSGVKVKAVDTTGAGDAFTGAILYCLAADTNLLKVTEYSYKLISYAK